MLEVTLSRKTFYRYNLWFCKSDIFIASIHKDIVTDLIIFNGFELTFLKNALTYGKIVQNY
jgi:hypothetical protein